MLSIDEAIERELNIAYKGSDCWKHCSNTKKHCKDCMDEHRQNAEWLEELKAYRQYIDLTEIPEQYKLGFQDGIIEGNNKAIDDFVRFANTMPTVEEDDGEIRPMRLEEMAEQLKEGERE